MSPRSGAAKHVTFSFNIPQVGDKVSACIISTRIREQIISHVNYGGSNFAFWYCARLCGTRLYSTPFLWVSPRFWLSSKLPRSHSSASPSSPRNSTGRSDVSKRSWRSARQRRSSFAVDAVTGPGLEWSTSYQAGSSSSAFGSSTENDSDDTDGSMVRQRGRAISPTAIRGGASSALGRQERALSERNHSSGSQGSRGKRRVTQARSTFTRSRSPASNHALPSQVLSPFTRSRLIPNFHYVLPAGLRIETHLPCTNILWTFAIDAKKLAEYLLLVGSLLYATAKLLDRSAKEPARNVWLSIEIIIIIIASFYYIIWSHSCINFATSSQPEACAVKAPSSSNTAGARDGKRNAPVSSSFRGREEFGYLWMSVPKNYRESSDDGVLTGLMLVPLISIALLYAVLEQARQFPHPFSPAPRSWLIEPPMYLSSHPNILTPLQALVLARYSLVNLATLCSTILLFSVCASSWAEARFRRRAKCNAPDGERSFDGERGSVPRSEAKRSLFYMVFALGVTMGSLCLKYGFHSAGIPIWQHLTYFEVVAGSLFYQLTLYVSLRLAHRVFTLGELSLVCFGGTSLWMELLNITIARMWSVTTPFIKTYRLPTPLLIFQLALIMGSLLTGFLLSPLLVLSRHIAQRPVRRLRFPQEKPRHRRALAAAFYIGTILIVGGLIGIWTRWCLGSRDPWLWVLHWLLDGKKVWTRPALLLYWGLLCGISLAGWNRQLARSRKYWSRNTPPPVMAETTSFSEKASEISDIAPSHGPANGGVGATLSLPFPSLPNGKNVSDVATDLLDAADKHVPTLSLNARRKFFHALAVVMFLPGIVVDPAFTHLSFSVAFALFTFTEYVRYFALYPFGAAVHLFMNEFLDSKDSGTAILSHFYLLIGCAGSVWLEGQTNLVQLSGILAVGVGDALASIVGKRIGRMRWSPTTFKTLEGSGAFTLSIVASTWVLRLLGFVEKFSTWRYTLAVGLSSALEALSVQNDNLTLPLYMWSILILSDVG